MFSINPFPVKSFSVKSLSMLQRRYWHFAPLNTGPIIDQKRRRVNLAVRTFVIENGGGLFGMRVNPSL
jgi:hypothetical protein